MNIKELIAFVVSLTKLLPLQSLVELYNVIFPLPSFTSKESMGAWYDGLTIGGSLKSVLLGFIKDAPLQASSTPDITEEEMRLEVATYLDSQSTGPMKAEAIDPATVAIIIQLATALWNFIKNRRNK